MTAPRLTHSGRIDLLSGQPDAERRGTTLEVVDEPWGQETGLLAAVGAFSDGDPVGALDQVCRVLEADPGNAGAGDFLARVAPAAQRELEARLAPSNATVRLAVPPEELHTVPLCARDGAVIARIDGRATVADVCDLAGLPRLDVLRTLAGLLDDGVISLESRPADRRPPVC